MSECHMHPTFLSDEDVLGMHARQLEVFGGEPGIRDFKLLDSALAQPRQTFGSKYLHNGLFEMAAAYLYHLVQGHPFIDGNKRVGLNAALVFLSLNGVEITHGTVALTEMTLAVARGELNKDQVAAVLLAAAGEAAGAAPESSGDEGEGGG